MTEIWISLKIACVHCVDPTFFVLFMFPLTMSRPVSVMLYVYPGRLGKIHPTPLSLMFTLLFGYLQQCKLSRIAPAASQVRGG